MVKEKTIKNNAKTTGGFIKEMKSHGGLYAMMVPGILFLLIFNYVPLLGITIAFRDSNTVNGYFSGDWVGFKNFEFFFKSQDAFRIIRNTLGMNGLFIITGTIASVGIAIMLNEISSRRQVKLYQSTMLFPYMMSWVILGYVSYAFLNQEYGFLNSILGKFGIEPVNWYNEPKYWPAILAVVSIIKGAGYNAVLYYAKIMGIDQTIYEAAEVDGASRLDMALKITLPQLKTLMITLILLAIGKIFYADFGLFYYIPRESGALFSVTDVMDTYVYRALRVNGNIGMSSAVGLLQSIVGFVLVLLSNYITRKIDSESALF